MDTFRIASRHLLRTSSRDFIVNPPNFSLDIPPETPSDVFRDSLWDSSEIPQAVSLEILSWIPSGILTGISSRLPGTSPKISAWISEEIFVRNFCLSGVWTSSCRNPYRDSLGTSSGYSSMIFSQKILQEFLLIFLRN